MIPQETNCQEFSEITMSDHTFEKLYTMPLVNTLSLTNLTEYGSVSIKLSDSEPPSNEFERSLEEDVITFMRQASSLNDFSDGVKAFVGLVISTVSASKKIGFIDEPEAFLHPSLCYKLGKVLADAASSHGMQFYLSTHSSSFIMGALLAGTPMKIVRLSYEGQPTARLLENDKLRELMKNPLLRSTGVIEALFFRNVIVCEGDADRAFYQEINARLNSFMPEKGINDCLFLNAQGKDTIWKIVKMLREMGISAVGIYDLDIIKNEHTNWTHAMDGINMPLAMRDSIASQRISVYKSFKSKLVGDQKLDLRENFGIENLNPTEFEVAENLFNQLELYGMFVVRIGEVEQWLRSLRIRTYKSNWLASIFEKMGSDPGDIDYVKPEPGDVWDFIYSIKQWMNRPNKKGTY
jgi:hypothetical protein